MKITLSDLAKALHAETVGDVTITVSKPLIDSRSLRDADGVIFFALSTSTGNGAYYINDLYKRGVRAFVLDKSEDIQPLPGATILRVDNVFKALSDSGKYIRSLINIPVVAITGSRAKTVVKEKLASILKGKLKIARSPRSYNSQIGVPLSMWQVEDDTDVLIIEAGVSQHGEMQALKDIVQPTYGIFTCITGEHARAFSSAEDKCHEKSTLFTECKAIVYPASNNMIGEVLSAQCPKSFLMAAANYDDMAVKAAGLLGVECDAPVAEEVSARIDFVDTVDGYTIAYDNFTCDYLGIATGLDAVQRRLGKDERLFIVTDPQTASQSDIKDLLKSHNLTDNVIALTGEKADDVPANLLYGGTVYINGRDKRVFGRLFSSLCGRGHITRLEVNLDNLDHNLKYYKQLLPHTTGIIGMIKASAYGCGDIEVARSLQSAGAAMVAVAVADEGVALRRAGITLPILVLDPWCENMRSIFAYNLQPTVIDADEDTLRRLEKAACAEGVTQFDIHVKLDTGMHRVGLSKEDILTFCSMLTKFPQIRIASVFSHLATADCLDMDDYTEQQLSAFDDMCDQLQEHVGYKFKRHILNTAGITRFGKKRHDELARLGIGLYGISPLPEIDSDRLKPVAKLMTRIIRTHHYKAGQTIGYSRKGVLTRDSIIATLPVGYADGIDRRLGNGNASFMVNGKLCPTVGNICMDLCMIDITDCPDTGDGSVEIFGNHIPIETPASTLGTIPYEILTSISPRVKRIYFRE